MNRRITSIIIAFFYSLILICPAISQDPEPNPPHDRSQFTPEASEGADPANVLDKLEKALSTIQVTPVSVEDFSDKKGIASAQRVRRSIGALVREARIVTEAYRKYLSDISRDRQRLETALTLPSQEQVKFLIESDTTQIESKEVAIRAARKNLETAPNDDGILAYLRQKEGELLAFKASIEGRRELLKTITVDKEVARQELAKSKQVIPQIQATIQRADALIRLGDETLLELDSMSGRALEISHAKTSYTYGSTVIFSVLVALIIGGFFLMASRNNTILEQIFTGQSGIQFLTLFSLIIAIILFGILNIIEGRELAILLGGISGFILGKTSDGNIKQPANQGAGQNPPRLGDRDI